MPKSKIKLPNRYNNEVYLEEIGNAKYKLKHDFLSNQSKGII